MDRREGVRAGYVEGTGVQYGEMVGVGASAYMAKKFRPVPLDSVTDGIL